MREVDVAAPLVKYLSAEGFRVHQEVEAPFGRADLVAQHRAGVLWAVECKRSLGLPVLSQAERWLDYANQVSVCTAAPRRESYGWDLGIRVCEHLGIGLFVVAGGRVDQIVQAPTRQPKHRADMLSWLAPDQLDGLPAGSAGGGYSTPFKRTCKRLAEYVAAHPGITVNEALKHVKHHYAGRRSARSNLTRLLRLDPKPAPLIGVRLETTECGALLWPVSEEVF